MAVDYTKIQDFILKSDKEGEIYEHQEATLIETLNNELCLNTDLVNALQQKRNDVSKGTQ